MNDANFLKLLQCSLFNLLFQDYEILSVITCLLQRWKYLYQDAFDKLSPIPKNKLLKGLHIY